MPVTARRAAGRTRRLFPGALLAACVVMQAGAVHASRPVPRTIEGCVTQGVFTSDDGYVIRVRQDGFEAFDLAPFEGRRIRARGMLLPGDLFHLRGRPRDLGPCRDRR